MFDHLFSTHISLLYFNKSLNHASVLMLHLCQFHSCALIFNKQIIRLVLLIHYHLLLLLKYMILTRKQTMSSKQIKTENVQSF